MTTSNPLKTHERLGRIYWNREDEDSETSQFLVDGIGGRDEPRDLITLISNRKIKSAKQSLYANLMTQFELERFPFAWICRVLRIDAIIALLASSIFLARSLLLPRWSESESESREYLTLSNSQLKFMVKLKASRGNPIWIFISQIFIVFLSIAGKIYSRPLIVFQSEWLRLDFPTNPINQRDLIGSFRGAQAPDV